MNKEDHNYAHAHTRVFKCLYKSFKAHLPFLKRFSKDSAVTASLKPPRQTLENIFTRKNVAPSFTNNLCQITMRQENATADKS